MLPLATRLAPEATARVLARRYLRPNVALLGDPDAVARWGTVVRPAPGLTLLRRPAAAGPEAPRVLIAPGLNGHFRQFTRLAGALGDAGLTVDFLVLPGHGHPGEGLCGLNQIVSALETVTAQARYHGIVAHCVSANAALLAPPTTAPLARLALVSAPLDLPRLIRLGGTQYGLTGPCLDRFCQHVSALGAPWPTDSPWQPGALAREDTLLMVHGQHDDAAPPEDLAQMAEVAPRTRIALFESGGPNSILTMHGPCTQLAAFMRP
ncbi:hypothetical protein P279_09260 [Rhodobacteraceae bacterium PD-2]|nr:hypothetical protein P279_09260 [Rhodobacteraceae bacterium PD-2]